jgi:hypothetical protein
VVGHDLVYGELLLGGHADRKQLLADYSLLWFAATVSHGEVVAFVRQHRLHGRGIGWIDAHLLAATLVARHTLWTFDRNLAAVAREFGIAHPSAKV